MKQVVPPTEVPPHTGIEALAANQSAYVFANLSARANRRL